MCCRELARSIGNNQLFFAGDGKAGYLPVQWLCESEWDPNPSPDLAVGAPSVGSGQLTYNVRLGGRQRWRGGLGHGAVMPNASFQTVFLGLGSQSFLVLLYFRV